MVHAKLRDGCNEPPRYPPLARRLGLEGVVVLRLRVDREGKVKEVVLAEPSPHAILNRAATRAAEQWQFEPARRGDALVEDVIEKTVRFVLIGA